jgi:hypothetical protein
MMQSVTIGGKGSGRNDRVPLDYYATPPEAVEMLLKHEAFCPVVYEVAAGEGHIAKVLEKSYVVFCSDIVRRDYPLIECDFLAVEQKLPGDIITNPPYKLACEFIRHAHDVTVDDAKIAMFLKLQFLEGVSHRKLLEEFPPARIYVPSRRLTCARNGDFEHTEHGAICYAWFIWDKTYHGETVLRFLD